MKKHSLHQRILRSSIVMIGIVAVLLFALNAMELYITNRNQKAFATYTELGNYFDSVYDAGTYVKEYLYTENEEVLTSFQQKMEVAKESVDHIDNNIFLQEEWRFSLLGNMLESFEEICTKAILDVSNKQLYQKIVDTNVLIQGTSGDYYHELTNIMNAQMEQLKKVNYAIIAVSIIVLAILLGWICYVALILMQTYIRPLYEVLDNIAKIKSGTYDFTNIANKGIEMQQLSHTLEDMANAVQNEIKITKEKAELQNKLLETENENLRKDELLAKSELRILQNQINPHFLFNTLNMIYRLCLTKESETAAEMLLKTSQLLRYSLDNQNKLSNIGNELREIRYYIDIQKLRFGERIQFLVYIENEEKLKNIQFPVMILQPLVENAVKHGLKNVVEDGEVEIYIGEEDGKLIVSVSDNGEGIAKDDADVLLKRLEDSHTTHLGLYNVVQRLKMCFQQNVQMRIESDIDCGFSFIAEITNFEQ